MNNIKKLRTKLGLTVRELAKKANVAVSYISVLENDTEGNTNPTKDVMTSISNALCESVQTVFFPGDGKSNEVT